MLRQRGVGLASRGRCSSRGLQSLEGDRARLLVVRRYRRVPGVFAPPAGAAWRRRRPAPQPLLSAGVRGPGGGRGRRDAAERHLVSCASRRVCDFVRYHVGSHEQGGGRTVKV